MSASDVPSRLLRVSEDLSAVTQETRLREERESLSVLPKPRQLMLIVQELKDLLFPGFWQEPDQSIDHGPFETGARLNSLFAGLSKQLVYALNAFPGEGRSSDQPSVDRAAELTIKFLERLPAVRQMLAMDALAAFNGDPACLAIEEAILCYPGIQAVAIHRMAHELYRMQVPLIPRMMAEVAHLETGIDIHPGAQIGDHFFVDHGTGVVIGETTVIGSHVKIYQGVTLGALSFPTHADGSLIRDEKRHPNIEDNVIIYANSTVLGGKTTIGHDSVIGSNVWITSSVQPHTTVVMEKPKLRMRNEREDELVSSLNYQI